MNSFQITLFIILLIVDLVITAARATLLNVRYAHLLSLRDRGESRVSRTIELVRGRTRLRFSLKLAQAVLRFLMAGLLLTAFVPIDGFNASAIIVGLILVLAAVLIWFGEFLIERVVMGSPESWAVRLTPVARLFVLALSPLLLLPNWLLRGREIGGSQLVTITEDELKSLVDASQRAGVLEQDERKMIFSIFQLGDTLAREIMVPRIDTFALDVDTPLGEAADMVLETGFSRVPVFQEQIDNIVGILYTKDLLKAWREGNHVSSLRELVRPPNFIPETKKVDELLAEMQAERIHIAIVVDEFGGVSGLVTLEDIVEEIFGEIQDEYDQAEELPYQKLEDGEYLFRGRIDLDDFNDLMDVQFDTTEADTLGGLIYSRLGRVPKPGETVEEDNLLLTIEQVTSRRIRKVRARRKGSPEQDDQPESEKDRDHADG